MRVLLDQDLSRRVAALLREAGHDVAHVAERGMATALDDDVFETAAAEERVLAPRTPTSARSWLDRVRARRRSSCSAPSSRSGQRTQAALLLANLPHAARELEEGAIVVLGRGRMRVRPLPIAPAD